MLSRRDPKLVRVLHFLISLIGVRKRTLRMRSCFTFWRPCCGPSGMRSVIDCLNLKFLELGDGNCFPFPALMSAGLVLFLRHDQAVTTRVLSEVAFHLGDPTSWTGI